MRYRVIHGELQDNIRYRNPVVKKSPSLAEFGGSVTMTTCVVLLSPLCIRLRRDGQVGLLAAGMLIVKLLEKRHAPLAARTRAQTVGKLRRHRGVLSFQISAELPQTDAKTKTDMIIGMHEKRHLVLCMRHE